MFQVEKASARAAKLQGVKKARKADELEGMQSSLAELKDREMKIVGDLENLKKEA